MQLAQGGSGGAQMMNADFVVDASGRGSSSPAWLGAWGYPKPREELIKINLGYVTRQYRRLPEHLRGMSGAIIAACPPDWRFGVIPSQEGDRWIVTLGGYLGDHAPTDDNGFVGFARSLQKPEIFDLVRVAEPTLPADTFGRISAPCLPQAVQTKSGSTSDNLMLSGQRSALNVVEWLHRVIALRTPETRRTKSGMGIPMLSSRWYSADDPDQ